MSSVVELYEFRAGEDEVWRYTTRGHDLLANGHVWHATTMTRDDHQITTEVARDGMRLQFPLDHPFASQWLGYGPEHTVILNLYRKTGDDSYELQFKGRIADSESNQNEIYLVVESLLTSLKQAGLPGRMQKFCRHVLYGRGCHIDPQAYAVPSNITAIDARLFTVTCPSAAEFADGWFTGGMITMPSGALRYITGHVGDQITLWRPAPELENLLSGTGGVTFGWGNNYGHHYGGPALTTLYPGCDGALRTCDEKFNNLDNNGAFYWLPPVNPYGANSVF